jgi:hypothetical protein
VFTKILAVVVDAFLGVVGVALGIAIGAFLGIAGTASGNGDKATKFTVRIENIAKPDGDSRQRSSSAEIMPVLIAARSSAQDRTRSYKEIVSA